MSAVAFLASAFAPKADSRLATATSRKRTLAVVVALLVNEPAQPKQKQLDERNKETIE